MPKEDESINHQTIPFFLSFSVFSFTFFLLFWWIRFILAKLIKQYKFLLSRLLSVTLLSCSPTFSSTFRLIELVNKILNLEHKHTERDRESIHHVMLCLLPLRPSFLRYLVHAGYHHLCGPYIWLLLLQLFERQC